MSQDAWIAWSALTEPAHPIAGWLRETWGAERAWDWVRLAESDPSQAVQQLMPVASSSQIATVLETAQGWIRRLEIANPEALRRHGHTVGARVLTPADHDWPEIYAELGPRQPCALWLRGAGDVGLLSQSTVAVVGSRSATQYGTHVASTMAHDLTCAGVVVVSGGAYGIDAAAHRGALAAGGPTVAVLAGGIDRLYPAGNQDLLEAVMDAGLVVSEVPPGFAPHRQRFLSRNRLIAQSTATVVVEAARRSGALSTARHAMEVARPVGAVPGPVTSPASSGCHYLMREAQATLVTSARDVMDLIGPLDGRPEDTADTGPQFDSAEQRQTFDALGLTGATVDQIVAKVGLPASAVSAALGALEMAGMVVRTGSRWRRAQGGAHRHRRNPRVLTTSATQHPKASTQEIKSD